SWATPRFSRWTVRVIGLYFLGMALLQAWPGRGFWVGTDRSGAGAVTSMVRAMAQTPQPRFLSSWLGAFAAFDGAHGWGVNLFVVVALAALGTALLTGAPRLVQPAAATGVVLCLATWVLVQDLGFLGGVGTDPNTMVPTALLLVAGWFGVTGAQAPAVVADARAGGAPPLPVSGVGLASTPPPSTRPAWRGWTAPGGAIGRRWTAMSLDPAHGLHVIAAACAFAVVLLGTVPMVGAAVSRRADPILIEAIDGTPTVSNRAAPPFRLVDQDGVPVSLDSLRGKVLALTFLDDVCTSVCPAIAQELRGADQLIGPTARRHVALVAINANPRFVAPEYLTDFDDEEGFQRLPNWLFLTGSTTELRRVWRSYGIEMGDLPGGARAGGALSTSVIDASGRIRWRYSAKPGPDTAATESSYSALLASAIEGALAPG
ncbi:MAG: SCO family protein, partial [Acidimicrobiales bacterium]